MEVSDLTSISQHNCRLPSHGQLLARRRTCKQPATLPASLLQHALSAKHANQGSPSSSQPCGSLFSLLTQQLAQQCWLSAD
jgi:hypothetical protein